MQKFFRRFYLIGDTLTVAKGKITNAKLNYKIIGKGDKVINQIPSSTESLHSGGIVLLYTEEGEDTVTQTTVPDFTNLSVSAANATAVNAGLNIQFAGNTSASTVVAYKQSLSANTTVNTGSVITVYFRDTKAENVAD